MESANPKAIHRRMTDVYGDNSQSIPQWQSGQQNLNVYGDTP